MEIIGKKENNTMINYWNLKTGERKTSSKLEYYMYKMQGLIDRKEKLNDEYYHMAMINYLKRMEKEIEDEYILTR